MRLGWLLRDEIWGGKVVERGGRHARGGKLI